jgi:hypothetical protein
VTQSKCGPTWQTSSKDESTTYSIRNIRCSRDGPILRWHPKASTGLAHKAPSPMAELNMRLKMPSRGTNDWHRRTVTQISEMAKSKDPRPKR